MPSKSQIEQAAIEPALVTINAGCEYLAVSPAEMYRLLGLKKVEGVKAGKRTLLKVSSFARAASLPPAKIKPPTIRRRKSA
jgi:hypothetical protein